ncbi:NAD(P)-binding protein [Motilimonas sp. E26]|uniref:NAD(P)-binding protein n=1 Tax=Motilimonas sp. E26 TaxID=2865674 RepID=UPI001E5C4804|nr:NAD(P)-binding protein [Motilimonas sp. E26]MCE0556213.1 NAD(P)-binding protein [Motilimonas sp. E26]
MSCKRAVVVGAGVVGLVSAFILRKQGFDVTIIDSEAEPGGLLRSIKTDFGAFDYGTHVASSSGIDELDDFMFNHANGELKQFDTGHSASFYDGRLSSISPFVNLSEREDAMVLSYSLLEQQGKNTSPKNLETLYRNHYGDLIFEKVIRPIVLKYFGCPAHQLSPACFSFFDLNRVLAFNPSISEQLKQLDDYNCRIGYHHASSGAAKYYPKQGGIGRWYLLLLDKLKSQGVKVLTGCQCKNFEQDRDNSIKSISTSQGMLDTDLLVWSVPSAFLARYLNSTSAPERPVFRNTALFHFAFDKPLLTDAYYINVHEPEFLSGRVTVYQNLTDDNDVYRVTVEALNEEGYDFQASIDHVIKELNTMGIIDHRHHCLYQNCVEIKNGFPVLSAKGHANQIAYNEHLTASYPNLVLVGRGSGKGFFMADLLIQAAELIKGRLV